MGLYNIQQKALYEKKQSKVLLVLMGNMVEIDLQKPYLVTVQAHLY